MENRASDLSTILGPFASSRAVAPAGHLLYICCVTTKRRGDHESKGDALRSIAILLLDHSLALAWEVGNQRTPVPRTQMDSHNHEARKEESTCMKTASTHHPCDPHLTMLRAHVGDKGLPATVFHVSRKPRALPVMRPWWEKEEKALVKEGVEVTVKDGTKVQVHQPSNESHCRTHPM